MEYKYKWLCKYDKIKNQTKYYQLAREATAEDNGEMYFENIDSATGTFTLAKTGTPTHIPNLEYRVGNGNWTTYDMNTLPGVEVPSGAKIYFRGDNSATEQFNADSYRYFRFSMTTKHNVGGYITSLLVKEGFKNFEYTKSAPDSLGNIFRSNTNLVNANSLILSISKLRQSCYANMFLGCTSLITAPALPATTLALTCYYSMFYNCTSLTTAPELPATKLEQSCYNAMFQYCTALTTAPALPATTLALACYFYMFSGCTALTTPPELPATTLAPNCYNYMFYNCTSLTTAPELPATTLQQSCYSNMFYGCTSLVSAPELPATTLANQCYNYMFYNCTSLTTAPELPAKRLISSCYASMFQGCSKLNSVTAWFEMYDYNNNACSNWLVGVASTGTFTKLKGVEIPTGTSGIPTGWTVKDSLPVEEFYIKEVDGETAKFKLLKNNAPREINLEYKIGENGTWTTYDMTTLPEITVPKYGKLYLRGDNPNGINNSSVSYYRISFSNQHNVGGYLSSLLSKENFENFELDTTNKSTYYAFAYLFQLDETLYSAENLIISFKNLPPGCFRGAFDRCTNLRNAPVLSATTLTLECYTSMFFSCSNLTSVTALFEEYSEDACGSWLSGVASTGTFKKLKGVEIPEGDSGIPTGWTVVEI